MTTLCLPVVDWPKIDRERWCRAQEPAAFLEDDKPATRWSPARRRIVEQAYGQWLGFLDRAGMLDPLPGMRLSIMAAENAANHIEAFSPKDDLMLLRHGKNLEKRVAQWGENPRQETLVLFTGGRRRIAASAALC